MRAFVGAKLHGITVTGADLHYHGSITLDPELCRTSGIYPLEYVSIWNKTNGARLSTYVIFGDPGSRCCILNGAAARLCQEGDVLIIASHAYMDEHALAGFTPKVVTFRDDNVVDQILSYSVAAQDDWFSFEVRNLTPEDAPSLPVCVPTIDINKMRQDLRARGLDEKAIADFLACHVQAA